MKKLFFEHDDGVHATLYDYFSTPEELISMGESLIKNESLKPLLKRLVEYRKDVFTSDRELAAFAITYKIFSQK